MELGLKDGTSTYCLTVSTQQMDKIRESFRSLHDLDLAVSKGLDLGKFCRRLDHMNTGYRIAYGVADNFAILSNQLDQWSHNCGLQAFDIDIWRTGHEPTYITAKDIPDVACNLGVRGDRVLLQNTASCFFRDLLCGAGGGDRHFLPRLAAFLEAL